MKRRLLAVCLTLAMFVTMMPMAALASDAPSLNVGSTTVEAGGSGSVEVSISGNTGFDTISFQIAETTGVTITSVSVAGGIISSWFPSYNESTRKFSAVGSAAVSDNGVICTINFTVDAAASGDIALSLEEDSNADGILMNGDDAVSGVSFTAGTITVGTSTPTTGYTATLTTSASNNEVVSEGTINVNVAVSHSSDTVFNAGEIKLTYDSTKLTPNTTSLDAMVTASTLSGYKINNNELVIEDFGSDKTMSADAPYTYSIPFTAAEVSTETTDTVELTRAAFIHKENADKSDLIEATKTTESLTVTIKVAMVNVTLTNSADSTETTTTTTQKGVDYTFAPADTANYTYSDVEATVNGKEVEVVDNGDGTFTIDAAYVTGDIALTYTKTANSYNVSYEGAGADDLTTKPTTATYGQKLTVTLPDDIPAGTEVGYTYGISAKIGDTFVGTYDSTTRILTINGTDITGNITITVTKEEKSATQVTITVAGDSGLTIKNVTGNTTTVEKDTSVTLVLTEEEGYIYTVVDSSNKEVTFTNGEYTFNATVSETYTVTKTLDVSSVKVTEYVNFDGFVVYLVTYEGNLEDDKVPTYDGNIMYKSDSYEAYCWLVIGSTLTEDTAKTKIGAQDGTATKVDYGMDINGTTTTDAADAQLVWNMYNAMYSDFNTVTMAQFLAADQNATSTDTANWGLNVQDAQVIITAILNGNATT